MGFNPQMQAGRLMAQKFGNAGSAMTGMPQGVGNVMSETGSQIPGYNTGAIQKFTPEQMQLFQNLFSQVSPTSRLAGLAAGDQSQMAQMEYPALNQFNQLQGGLASRFSGMGARRSSAFQNQASAAASDLAQQLQSQRYGIQRQALQDLMGISRDLLSQSPYEAFYTPKRRQPWQEMLASLGGGLGTGLGAAGAASAMGGLGTGLGAAGATGATGGMALPVMGGLALLSLLASQYGGND